MLGCVGDGLVDAADYERWRTTLGSTSGLAADGNGDGVVNAADYTVWRAAFAAATTVVPEPGAVALVAMAIAAASVAGRRV